MKRALIILAGVAFVATGGAALLMLYFYDRGEQEKNRSKTAAARAARWAKDENEKPPADENLTPPDKSVTDEKSE